MTGEELGRGAYGVVIGGYLDGRPVAVKEMRLRGDNSAQMLKNEINAHAEFNGIPGIVQLRGAWLCAF